MFTQRRWLHLNMFTKISHTHCVLSDPKILYLITFGNVEDKERRNESSNIASAFLQVILQSLSAFLHMLYKLMISETREASLRRNMFTKILHIPTLFATGPKIPCTCLTSDILEDKEEETHRKTSPFHYSCILQNLSEHSLRTNIRDCRDM